MYILWWLVRASGGTGRQATSYLLIIFTYLASYQCLPNFQITNDTVQFVPLLIIICVEPTKNQKIWYTFSWKQKKIWLTDFLLTRLELVATKAAGIYRTRSLLVSLQNQGTWLAIFLQQQRTLQKATTSG